MKKLVKAAVIPLIALLIFILAMRNGYITGTADNNTGRFAVSAENYESFTPKGSNHYLYFFDETGKLVKRIDYYNRGGIKIAENSETVSLNKGTGVQYFDYLGNEKPQNTGKPVTRVYTPVSEPFSIKKQISFVTHRISVCSLCSEFTYSDCRYIFDNRFFASLVLQKAVF